MDHHTVRHGNVKGHDAAAMQWTNLALGRISINAPVKGAVLDTTTSPSKGKMKKQAAGAAATAAASAATAAQQQVSSSSCPPNEPTPRSGAFTFCYRDSVFVLGGCDALNDGGSPGALDCCYCITTHSAGAGRSTQSPTAGMASASSNSKRGGSPKKGGDTAPSTTKKQAKHHNAATNGAADGTGKGDFSRVACTGKAPPPRQWFAACLGYPVLASAGAPLPAGGQSAAASPPMSDTPVIAALLPHTTVNPSCVFVHGGLSVSASTTLASTADSNPQQAVASASTAGGWDDLWELRLGASSFSWVALIVKPPLPVKRFQHAMVQLNGRLYLFGGCDARSGAVLGDFFVLEDMPQSAAPFLSTTAGAGRRWSPVIPAGGCYAGGVTGIDDASVSLGKRPCARMQHSLAAGHSGVLLLYGGLDRHGTALNDLWCVDVGVLTTPFGVSNAEETPFVIWRQLALPCSLPRRLGSTLLVVPVPSHLQSGNTLQYAVVVCGGWDAATLSPFCEEAVASTNHRTSRKVRLESLVPKAGGGLACSGSVMQLLEKTTSTAHKYSGGSLRLGAARAGSPDKQQSSNAKCSSPMLAGVIVTVPWSSKCKSQQKDLVERDAASPTSALSRHGSVVWAPFSCDGGIETTSDGADEEGGNASSCMQSPLTASLRVLGGAGRIQCVTRSPQPNPMVVPAVVAASRSVQPSYRCSALLGEGGILSRRVAKALAATKWITSQLPCVEGDAEGAMLHEDDGRDVVWWSNHVARTPFVRIDAFDLRLAGPQRDDSELLLSPSRKSPTCTFDGGNGGSAGGVAPLSASLLEMEHPRHHQTSAQPPPLSPPFTPDAFHSQGTLSLLPAAVVYVDNDGVPLPAAFSGWCRAVSSVAPTNGSPSGHRGSGTASSPNRHGVKLYCFGGDMTPMVKRSDLWCCEIKWPAPQAGGVKRW